MTTFSTKYDQDELERLRREVAELRDVEKRLRREIEERKHVEGSLRASETRFRTLVEQSPFSIIIYGKDGRLLMDNQASKILWNVSQEDYSYLVKEYNILEDEVLAKSGYLDDIKRAFAGEAVTIPPAQYDLQDFPYQESIPKKIWLAAHAYPVKDEEGHVHEVVIMHENVTGRKRAEEALKQSQEQLEAFFNQSLDGCFFMMLDEPIRWDETVDKAAALDYVFAHQRISRINQAMLDQYGVDESEFIGLTPTDFFTHEVQLGRETWRDLFDNGRLHMETGERKVDGTLMWIEGEYVCLYDEHKRITGHFGIQREITVRKQAEADLRQSEALHRTLVRTIPYGVHEVAKDGRIVFVNPAFCHITGYTEEELIGRYIRELLPDEAEQRRLQEIVRYLYEYHPEPETYFAKLKTKDGRIIETQTDWDYHRATDGIIAGTIAVVTDISSRKQAEERLQNYAQRLQVMHAVAQAILSAQSPEAIAYAALGRVQQALPFIRCSLVLFDFEVDEGFVLATLDEQEIGIRSGVRRPLNQFDMDERLFAGEPVLRERLHDRLPELTKRLQAEGVHSYLCLPLLAQGQLMGAIYVAAKEYAMYSEAYIETMREIAEFLAIAIQQARLHEQVQQYAIELEQRVTERTRSLTEANERLRELDRLKTKFISDVTHELRTPVTNMILYLDLIERNPAKFDHYHSVLRTQSERLSALVESTLDLSRLDFRRHELKFNLEALNPTIEQAVRSQLLNAQNDGLELKFMPGENLPKIMIASEQLGQMLDSLLLNAINYTAQGHIEVHTFLNESADHVAIRIRDSGMGMTPEDLRHCFEPFYRGELVGQLNIPGNGLGLAIVKEIVDLHNGRIEVETVVDEGTTFTVWLPHV